VRQESIKSMRNLSDTLRGLADKMDKQYGGDKDPKA
jgi:hypothetical protein